MGRRRKSSHSRLDGLEIAHRRDSPERRRLDESAAVTSRLRAVYKVRSNPSDIEARAEAIAIEQSVEMPLSAIRDASILSDIVGEVTGIEDCGDGSFEVRIDLAAATIGDDAGQLMNMLFGNSSLHDDVALCDAIFPHEMLAAFGGPSHGLSGLRSRVGATERAMTSSALKPQGLAPDDLAVLAFELAKGGLDFIKDDHGLANQPFSPFAERVRACAAAIDKAQKLTGRRTRYRRACLDPMPRWTGKSRSPGTRVSTPY